MYYAKYIKYKNKYLNLKYQLAGAPIVVSRVRNSEPIDSNPQLPKPIYSLEQQLNKSKLKNKKIPPLYENLEKIDKSLEENLVGIKILEADSVHLEPIVKYNKQFKSNPIYFYRYTGTDRKVYILCSLYSYFEFLDNLKESIKIEKININKEGYISLNIQDTTIPKVSKDINIVKVKESLEKNLVGVKILETDSFSLVKLNIISKESKFKYNPIHFYRYTDTDGRVYILCSMYSYYEFLDILYKHIEIEEINIDEKGIITHKLGRIYHIIPKPKDIEVKQKQTISIPIKPNIYSSNLKKLVDDLSINFFIIIISNQLLLNAICMYNLFIGTIHVFVINIDKSPSTFFLLSLFTEYELMQYIDKQPNIELYECRLFKQGDKIEYKLNKDMVAMMFHIYAEKRKIPNFFNESRYYRSNPAFDYLFLDKLDPKLLEKCRDCISVRDVAFNTTLCFLPEKIQQAINHKDIQEMINDFVENKHYLNNSNDKLMSWRQRYENLIQLWEYSLEDLREEVEKFKKELLNLEPCHKELLVLKLNEKGFKGDTMDKILENNALCYLDEKEEKNKRLVYENSVQIDPIDNEFVKNCKFIPEMKKLLEKKDLCEDIEFELHKYRQTILMFLKNNENQIMYTNNQLYFFAFSWYDHKFNVNYDKTFDPLEWSIKFNKLAFQCLALKDIIFPLRIINIEYLDSPLTFSFNINKLTFCGYFHTSFNDNYNGNNNFNIECRDKFYFLYQYGDNAGNLSGKEYRLFYFTGNNIWFEISMLPYYKIILCEINWIYYTFILKYGTIPHFYKYINNYCEEEIVVSKFSLDEIRYMYKEKGYNELELRSIDKEVFYNHKYYYRKDIHERIFVDNPLLKTEKEKTEFINKVSNKNKIRVK